MSKDRKKSSKLVDVPSVANAPVRYIDLLNWYWEIGVYLSGMTPHIGFMFLAIVNCINRNWWHETAITYDRLANLVGGSKPTYYNSLKWLNEHGLITYVPGRNAHATARFFLGSWLIAAVKNHTTALTTALPVVDHYDTAALTSGLPIIKDNKTNRNKDTQKSHDDSFDAFWDAYGKKVDRTRCSQKWGRLTSQEQAEVMKVIPAYVQATPDIQYRKNPLTFLNSRSWEDEGIGNVNPRDGHSKQSTPINHEYRPKGNVLT